MKYSKLPYHPERDFAPVSMLGATPYLLTVHPTVPARSVAQLVAHAKLARYISEEMVRFQNLINTIGLKPE